MSRIHVISSVVPRLCRSCQSYVDVDAMCVGATPDKAIGADNAHKDPMSLNQPKACCDDGKDVNGPHNDVTDGRADPSLHSRPPPPPQRCDPSRDTYADETEGDVGGGCKGRCTCRCGCGCG